MKNFFITAICIATGIVSHAQINQKGDVTIAPHVGAVFSSFNTGDDTSFNTREAIGLGAIVNYYFSDRWSLRSGLSYAPLGAEDGFNNTDKLNYISIPLNASWHLGNRRRFYLNFGLSGKFLLSAKGELSNGQEIDLENVIKGFDLGLDLGLGYKFSVSENLQLFGEIQGYTGFIEFLDVNDPNAQELRNRASIINIGAVFQL